VADDNAMNDIFVGTSTIRSPSGKWVVPISVVEIEQALGTLPSPRTLAAASIVIDELRQMETAFLFSLRGRPFSRSIKSILEYYNIHGDDLQDLVRILAHTQFDRPFFSLAIPANDDGLKQYLIDAGVFWEQVLFYYEFSLWDPIRFTGGFMLGLGDSAASILEVLKELFDFGVEAFNDLETAKKKIADFIKGIRQFSLESLWAKANEDWEKWQKEFSQALLDLDFDKAGFMLGKLGGDLWQLLTGIRALAKLPGMTLKLAKRFAGIFAKGARYTRSALILLAELLSKVAGAVKEAVEVGLSAIGSFFSDPITVLTALKNGALAAIDKYGNMIFLVPPEMELASSAGIVGNSFALFQETDNTLSVVARVRTNAEKALKQIQATLEKFSRQSRSGRQLTLKEIKEFEKLKTRIQKLVDEWRDSLIYALEDERKISELRAMITRREFGIWLHDHMKLTFDVIEQELKNFKSLTEVSIKTAAAEMGIAAELQDRASMKIIDFLKSRKDLWKLLGIKSEKELPVLIKTLGFKDPATAVIGSMRSDGILYDWFSGKLYSFDWTSGLDRYQFIKLWATAEKSDIPKLFTEFLRHAQREYVLRQAVLSFVF
jgi:hypothetical protein